MRTDVDLSVAQSRACHICGRLTAWLDPTVFFTSQEIEEGFAHDIELRLCSIRCAKHFHEATGRFTHIYDHSGRTVLARESRA